MQILIIVQVLIIFLPHLAELLLDGPLPPGAKAAVPAHTRVDVSLELILVIRVGNTLEMLQYLALLHTSPICI